MKAIVWKVIGALIGCGSFYLISDTVTGFVRKGKKYKVSQKPSSLRYGDDGEEKVIKILDNNFKSVYKNRFINEKMNEVDAIVYENGNIVFVEVKNWKGTVHQDDSGQIIQTKDGGYQTTHDNIFAKLEYLCRSFSKKIKSDLSLDEIKIDSFIVFPDECNIEDLKSKGHNAIAHKELFSFIDRIVEHRGVFDDSIKVYLENLPAWDIIISDDKYKVLIVSQSIEVTNDKQEKEIIQLKDASKIEIKNPFSQILNDTIIVSFKDKPSKQYEIEKCDIRVLNNNVEEKVSLRSMSEIIIQSL